MNQGVRSKSQAKEESQPHTILALYKFVSIPKQDLQIIRNDLETTLRSAKATGTILLAEEGINGTICYPQRMACGSGSDSEKGGDLIQDFLLNNEYVGGLRLRASYANAPIFHRLKVKIKKEIVTIGGGGASDEKNGDDVGNSKPISVGYMSQCVIDPTKICGEYVKSDRWDELCDDPEVVVIDTRNKYEIDIGTFEHAISPNTDNFRQFPDWLHRFAKACQEVDNGNDGDGVDDEKKNGNENKYEIDKERQCVINRNCTDGTANSNSTNIVQNARNLNPVPEEQMPIIKRKPKAVAMFCTGGIRCEKSTSYTLAAKVFPKDVPIYHLEGGVLAYLDSHPDENQSKWKGECFVFDQRVSVTHGLKASSKYHICHACRKPIPKEDMQGDDFVEGISCKYCKDIATDKQKARYEERQKQIEIAKKKGTVHIHDPKAK